MKSPRSIQRGILLLESLVAILIISFGILGLVGLWANSLKDASEAKYRSDATFLANEMISQMWFARPIDTSFTAPSDWKDRVAATLPRGDGKVEVKLDDNNQRFATVTVSWQLPGHDPHQYVSVARINGAGPM